MTSARERVGTDRDLAWEGCFNARDLGGLPTADGRRTRWGAVVRSASIDRLSADGWAAVRDHGIRTIVDLRREGEYRPVLPRPDGIDLVRISLDEFAGPDHWQTWGPVAGTPLFYQPFLDHCPQGGAAAVRAVARARPGGVLVHCAAGRDRTGLVIMLLLALAGVAADDIAADYLLSTPRLKGLWEALGRQDEDIVIQEILTREGTTARQALLAVLATLDTRAHLLASGLTEDDLTVVRERLLTA